MAKINRRDFIKGAGGALGAGLMLPVINRTAEGSTIVQQLALNAVGNGNILVIVELAGGIDGLNVMVPYSNYDTYASLRPNIGVPKELLEPLYGYTGTAMCPELANGNRTGAKTPNNGLKGIADAGKLAIVHAVGYPTPNLSHFTSRDIWYSATVDANISTAQRTGWVGRHSALFGNKDNALDEVSVGGAGAVALYASGVSAASIANNGNGDPSGYAFQTDGSFTGDRNNKLTAARIFDPNASASKYIDLWETTQLNAMNGADTVAAAVATYQNKVTYPANNGFAAGLKMIAKLAASTNPTVGTRVYYISTGGFDTHSNQATYKDANGNILATFTGDLPRLLGDVVAPALKAFYDDLVAQGLENRVTTMLWSEFGRRVAQNSSGTDHGTANNVLVMGGKVKGGFYGAPPSLTDLSSGNLKFKIDFRQVYATLIQDWLGGDPVPVLGGTFSNLGFIA